MGLLTPKRLKENEAFIYDAATKQIDAFIENGRFMRLLILGFHWPLWLLLTY